MKSIVGNRNKLFISESLKHSNLFFATNPINYTFDT
jgi:hypothetical protein